MGGKKEIRQNILGVNEIRNVEGEAVFWGFLSPSTFWARGGSEEIERLLRGERARDACGADGGLAGVAEGIGGERVFIGIDERQEAIPNALEAFRWQGTFEDAFLDAEAGVEAGFGERRAGRCGFLRRQAGARCPGGSPRRANRRIGPGDGRKAARHGNRARPAIVPPRRRNNRGWRAP